MRPGTGSRFQKRLGSALRLDGWRRSGEAPVVTMPSAGTFVRPLVNGWVAVLTARAYGRDEIELPSWLPGTHGVVTVEASATFPAAEWLGARLATADPCCGFEVARPFAVSGQEPGFRQFRGPEDDERVVAEIADYARHVLVPAAELLAGLDPWMAAQSAATPGESPLRAWKVPVMLLAYGREDEALRRLEAARQDPDLATDGAFGAFADRVEEFVRSGEALPTDGDALRAMAATRAGLVAASPVDAGLEGTATDEDADPDEDVSGWQALGGFVVIIAFVVFVVGKGAQIFGADIGWSWLPAAAVVAFGVLMIAERMEELRDKWRDRVGSAKRVQEYLDRQREERERLAAGPDDDGPPPDDAVDAQDSPPSDAAEGESSPRSGARDEHPDPGRE